jgi:hypothetical protein
MEEQGIEPEVPTITVDPMSPEGEFSLKFNVDMLSPSDTSTLDYESIMKFKV